LLVETFASLEYR